MDFREMIARRAALELKDGEVVNLGFGMPMAVANFIPEDIEVILQSENGCLVFGPTPKLGEQDADTANSGSMPITLKQGASLFDIFTSFGIIRGGHVDTAILGALEVDQNGSIANWSMPGRSPGMEGNGPRNGSPIQAGILLAGENCFAVDIVMAEVMGFNPEDVPLTDLALKQGLTPPLAGIDVVGSAKDLRLNFVEPRSLKSLEDRVPKWIAELGRNHLTASPKISTGCIGCGRCAAHCPPQAMTVSGGTVHINYDKCIRCYCCQELCPENAVTLRVGHLLKLAQYFW
jgi:ferredoxin